MKRSEKRFAILAAGLMALSLAACGASGSTGQPGTGSASAEAAASTTQTTAEAVSASAATLTPAPAEAAGAAAQTTAAVTDAGAETIANTSDVQITSVETSAGGGTSSGDHDSGDISDQSASAGSGTLVVYFSRTGEQYIVGIIDKGNTEIVADMIIEETGADRFEIVPEVDYYPYTYDELTDIAKQEQNQHARPAYAGEVPDLSQYSTIYIGAPVWWGDWPMICYTFFEANADGLAGKTLIPFSTHGGSGLSGFDKKLASACPDAVIGQGLAISGMDAQNHQDKVRSEVQSWIQGN